MPPISGGGESPDTGAVLEDYPFLSDRSTDRWFIGEYARLFPGPRSPAQGSSPFRTVGRKFVVGFTARVGSTLLCQNLFRYGVFVAEFFNPLHLEAETHVRGAGGYGDLCARLVETYALNDVWGLKAHVQSLIPLFMAGEFPQQIRSWRFVYVTRDNIIRQAISQVIAEQRQSWSSWDEPLREVSDLVYSYDDIARVIWSTRLSQASWEKFFNLFEIDPLRLSYETITADPEVAAARVADYCGLEPGGENLVAPFDDPPLRAQTTSVNSEWEQRFRRDNLSRGS